MIGLVAGVASSLLALGAPGGVPAIPPTDPPLPVEPGEAPERRLAEFSFAIFVTVEFDTDPGAYSCSGPDDADGTITCFALTDADRVIVAVSRSSAGTGVFDWQVVSDQTIAGSDAVTTSTSVPSPPSTEEESTSNLADDSIQSYGHQINRMSESLAADFIELSEGAIRTVNAYVWDPEAATLTLDVTLNPTMVIDIDTAAWVLAQAQKLHWVRGEPFRLQGATLRPSLVLVINGTRYESDFDLMVEVADQLITSDDWVAAARQG